MFLFRFLLLTEEKASQGGYIRNSKTPNKNNLEKHAKIQTIQYPDEVVLTADNSCKTNQANNLKLESGLRAQARKKKSEQL